MLFAAPPNLLLHSSPGCVGGTCPSPSVCCPAWKGVKGNPVIPLGALPISKIRGLMVSKAPSLGCQSPSIYFEPAWGCLSLLTIYTKTSLVHMILGNNPAGVQLAGPQFGKSAGVGHRYNAGQNGWPVSELRRLRDVWGTNYALNISILFCTMIILLKIHLLLHGLLTTKI